MAGWHSKLAAVVLCTAMNGSAKPAQWPKQLLCEEVGLPTGASASNPGPTAVWDHRIQLQTKTTGKMEVNGLQVHAEHPFRWELSGKDSIRLISEKGKTLGELSRRGDHYRFTFAQPTPYTKITSIDCIVEQK